MQENLVQHISGKTETILGCWELIFTSIIQPVLLVRNYLNVDFLMFCYIFFPFGIAT